MSTVRLRKARRARYGPWSNGMLMTPEEFDRETDFDELYSYELIHGVLIVSPPASASERGPVDDLGYLLNCYRHDHPEGAVMDGTLPEQTVACAENRRRADRVIWVGLGRTPDPEIDVPGIVIEFVSSRKRDRVRDYEEKRADYRNAGVQEYWIVDRFQRIMTVSRRTPSGDEQVVLKENDVHRTPLLPGFELSVARLLKEADMWTRRPKKRQQAKKPSDRAS